MRWAEISIEVKCNAAEEVASIASDYAPAGVAVLDPALIDEAKRDGGLSDLELGGLKREGNAIVRFFAPDDEAELAALLSEMRKRLDKEVNCSSTGRDVISINVRMVDEAEWSGWKQSFKPFRLGSKLLVSPTWEKPDALPEDLVIRIDPGQAFGTGQHATTAGCAHMLKSTSKAAIGSLMSALAQVYWQLHPRCLEQEQWSQLTSTRWQSSAPLTMSAQIRLRTRSRSAKGIF